MAPAPHGQTREVAYEVTPPSDAKPGAMLNVSVPFHGFMPVIVPKTWQAGQTIPVQYEVSNQPATLVSVSRCWRSLGGPRYRTGDLATLSSSRQHFVCVVSVPTCRRMGDPAWASPIDCANGRCPGLGPPRQRTPSHLFCFGGVLHCLGSPDVPHIRDMHKSGKIINM